MKTQNGIERRNGHAAALDAPIAYPEISAETMEKVLLENDLSGLTSAQRLEYVNALCRSLKLNPLTRPFGYQNFQGKLVLYAKKDCTDQLRRIHSVSAEQKSTRTIMIDRDQYLEIVTRGWLPDGRVDEAIGVVCISGLKGEQMANAYMKCETKSKRRLTLSICGLSLPDESELEDDDPRINAARARYEAGIASAAEPTELSGEEPKQIPFTQPEEVATTEQLQKLNEILSEDVWSESERDATKQGFSSLTKAKADKWIQQMSAKAEKRRAEKE